MLSQTVGSTSELWVNPVNSTFSSDRQGELPAARAGHTAAAVGHELYVVAGGSGRLGRGPAVIAPPPVLVYTKNTDSYTKFQWRITARPR